MESFLAATDIVDLDHPRVRAMATTLSAGPGGVTDTAKRCFEFVRDEISHTQDRGLDAVTCIASDVLAARTGFCYAKSHLLAALLRANGIPAGFCYQRLSLDEEGSAFCLHGLVALHIEGMGWYRVDPRGNRDGIDAQFDPPTERLAFSLSAPGELDFPEVWPDPLPVVVEALRTHPTAASLGANLPDISIWMRNTRSS